MNRSMTRLMLLVGALCLSGCSSFTSGGPATPDMQAFVPANADPAILSTEPVAALDCAPSSQSRIVSCD